MGAVPIVTITQTIPSWGDVITFQLLGDATYTRSGTAGGWQVVDRPRRQATTEFLDYGPYVLTLPLLLDGTSPFNPYGDGWQSVEQAIATVEAWQIPVGVEPPKVVVGSPAVAHTDLTWIVQDIAWDTAIRDPDTGERVQQKLTMTLWEYAPPNIQTSTVSTPGPAAAAQARQTANASPTTPVASGRTYTVKAGDTLGAIAVRFYGAYSKYLEIATLNGIRDPNFITVGQVLRLPAS